MTPDNTVVYAVVLALLLSSGRSPVFHVVESMRFEVGVAQLVFGYNEASPGIPSVVLETTARHIARLGFVDVGAGVLQYLADESTLEDALGKLISGLG